MGAIAKTKTNKYACRVSFRSKKDFLYFKSYLNACGGTIDEEINVPKTNGAKKKTELEQAIEDMENENYAFRGTFEEFKQSVNEIFNEK
jgi:hypothetical protein